MADSTEPEDRVREHPEMSFAELAFKVSVLIWTTHALQVESLGFFFVCFLKMFHNEGLLKEVS